ncbi:MAG: hypothetical protein KUL88_16425 [Rhizobium sp.]|nr:hypothetical protein [Rhizobium sp.]
MDDENWKLVERIANASEKTLAETIRLRADVARLHGRIEPFENERQFSDSLDSWPKPRTLKDSIDLIARVRDHIEGCERHLNAIRAVMDGISSDAISREEMKPWLKR